MNFRGGNVAENQIVSFINEEKSQIFQGNVMDYMVNLGFPVSNSVGSATKNKMDMKSKILAYNQNKISENNNSNNNNNNKFSCIVLTPKKKNSTGLSTIVEDNNDLNKSFIRNSLPKFEGISPIATKTLSPGNYNNKRTTSDLITTINGVHISPGELLQHCGPWPISIAKEKAKLTYPLAFDHPGSLTAEAKHGDLTLCRFDGDNGEYSLLLGNAKGVEGPKGMGTYLWVEVENIKRLEAKIVEGPYIHHCVGIHKDVVPVLYEACKYIGIKPDLYDPIEEQVKAYLRGE